MRDMTQNFLSKQVHACVDTAGKVSLAGMFVFTAIPMPAQASGMVEQRAGTWKTWVLNSGSELRLTAPPASPATADQVRWLKEFMA